MMHSDSKTVRNIDVYIAIFDDDSPAAWTPWPPSSCRDLQPLVGKWVHTVHRFGGDYTLKGTHSIELMFAPLRQLRSLPSSELTNVVGVLFKCGAEPAQTERLDILAAFLAKLPKNSLVHQFGLQVYFSTSEADEANAFQVRRVLKQRLPAIMPATTLKASSFDIVGNKSEFKSYISSWSDRLLTSIALTLEFQII